MLQEILPIGTKVRPTEKDHLFVVVDTEIIAYDNENEMVQCHHTSEALDTYNHTEWIPFFNVKEENNKLYVSNKKEPNKVLELDILYRP